MKDTIYALASGYGTAGVAVIRVSGPKANSVLSKISCLLHCFDKTIAMFTMC